jgi:hypothetical protein
MTEWLFFSVIMPLLPIPLVLLGLWMCGMSRKISSIIRDGQLCYYCTSLSASTISDLYNYNKGIPPSAASTAFQLQILFFGMMFCMILSIFSYAIAIIFSQTDNTVVSNESYEGRFALMSLGYVIATTLLAAFCHYKVS